MRNEKKNIHPERELNEKDASTISGGTEETQTLNESDLEQVSGGLEIEWEAMPTFIYSCMKCGATKYITAKTCPSEAPICCGIPMDLEGV